MSVAHRVSWLVLSILLVCQVPACYSQNENVLRKGIIPDPPWKWTDVSGSLMTYGPDASAIEAGKYYRTLELINGQLFVGGKAQLFSVDPANLETLDNVSIPTTGSTSCEFCDNYIRVIQPLPNGALLECGTNSEHPYCQQRSMGDLSVVSRIQYDVSFSIVPFTYNQNSTGWLLTEDFDLFVGTDLELSSGSPVRPAIVKSLLQTNSSQTTIDEQLRTIEHANVLLKPMLPPNPQFVGDPISYNGRVYFFFREIAVEFISERLVYSRVAVVCQNDTGGQEFSTLNQANIVTFVKARLTCSIDGTIPYDYNEIQNGAVLKAYLNANRSEAKVVEEISLDTDGRKTAVLSMLLSDSDQAVFVGTDIGVYKVPFQHCQDSTSRMDCLGTEDPYCRWNGTSCVNSDEGEQDLETGADNTGPQSITVHLAPNSPTRYLNVTNQPINLYLFAEAPTGQNLRVVNDEVPCTPCASLPYTEYRASSSGKEFLSLLIDGSNSAKETTNCSCTVVLAIDGGSNSSVYFDITVDNSAAVSANDEEISDLENFDNEIRRYKRTLQDWQTQVGDSCGLTDVQLCQAGQP